MIHSLHNLFKRFLKATASNQALKKPAIALITYSRAEYFEKVLSSVRSQEINNKPFSDYFDLYVFQDGLFDAETAEQKQGHATIAELCKERLDEAHFITQSTNLGVALHFDFVERFLFDQQDRPWVAFCEDDLVLSNGYLETLTCLADSFKDDDRIAMFSCFGKMADQPIPTQEANQHALISMEHHWGFGLHQKAWRKRQPLVDEYLKLLSNVPYRDREHGRIQNWQAFCGFKSGPTSQDYAKACSIAALGMVKVSSYANFATYIGEYGLHFTPELYAQKGYANSIVFPQAIKKRFELDATTYNTLLKQQQALTIEAPEKFDAQDFSRRLHAGNLEPRLSDQWQKNAISEADVVAAYKIFLGRLPETRQVIESRVGMHPERLLASFITAPEFRARKQFSPIILALAKEIIEENKKLPTA
jgi:hypothetical protein